MLLLKLLTKIVEIDDHIADRWFQSIVEKFQRLTGKNNFFLAKCCFGISWLSKMLTTYTETGSVVESLTSSLVLFLYIAASYKIEWHYEKINRNKQIRWINPLKYFIQGWRLFTWIFIAFHFLSSIFYPLHKRLLEHLACETLNFITIAGFYFLSCTPLPPGKSKLKAWTEAKIRFIKNLGSKSPEPLPVPS